MDKIFYPDSVAVIGVSEKPDNLAARIVANLLDFGYTGDIYAVGLRSGEVRGIPILASVDALPTDVDLAVILTPAATVPDLLDACGRRGIRRAVIESGGFSEFSEAGRRLEEQVCAVARRWDMRFVGPNCISVVNMENGLCLPFAGLDPRAVRRGPVSILAQSGGVSITYALLLSEAGLGINKIVSMGNKADLGEVDYLTYLLDDPGTEIIGLYLESIEDGRRLMEAIASSPKPVIVHKVNRSQASAQIAFSHTAALANDDRIVEAALRQARASRAESFDDAVAVAQGMMLPPVQGDDMVVVSRSGGHAVIAADVAEEHRFHLAPIPGSLAADVRDMFRADVIALTNPLDLGVLFDFDLYARIVEGCIQVMEPDALLLIHTFSAGSESDMSQRLASRVEASSVSMGRPVALCLFAQEQEVALIEQRVEIPVFTEIEMAVRALAAARDWQTGAPHLLPLPTEPAERPHEVEGLLACEDVRVLTTDAALGLCAAYGLPTGEWAVVEGVEGALVAAGAIGYPVALKALAPDIVHKSDTGGVVLNVAGPAALRDAFEALVERAEQQAQVRLTGVLVQRMVEGGRELILGGRRDPSFGPVVMFGLGGVYVEVFEDVAFRLAPLNRSMAEDMIDEVRGSRLLRGVRGESPLDVDGVVEALLTISRLLVECPEVMELDVNPLLACEQQVVAVDARAIVVCRKT